MSMPSNTQAPTLLDSHPHGDALATLARQCLLEAHTAGYDQLDAIVARHAEASGLTREQADTSEGNVFDAIAHPMGDGSELVARLLARSVRLAGEGEAPANARLLVGTAMRTRIDALAVLDEGAAGDDAARVWNEVAELVARYDTGSDVSRGEALVAASALGSSGQEAAQRRRAELAHSVRDATLARILRTDAPSSPPVEVPSLKGELMPAPRGVVTTVLLGAIGWLLLANLSRVIGRVALQLRRPAEVLLTEQGIKVRSSTTLLGKVLREQETLIPVDGLARATREVRFSRAGVYSGLVALALGSYFGVSWFIDGVRVGSLSLAAVGLLVLAAGVALDFVLMVALPGKKGRCRMLFVPSSGTQTCVGGVEASAADAFLQGIVRR